MTWDEFYEIWCESESARDVIKYVSALESVGVQDDVAEVIVDLGDSCKSEADRLLQLAMSKGQTFSGENLAYINGYCGDELWMQAVQISANHFTTADLDELWGTLDDEVLIAIAEKYRLSLPQDILDEIEENRACEREWEQDLGRDDRYEQDPLGAFIQDVAQGYDPDPMTQEYYIRSNNLSHLIGEADYALECLQRAYDNLTYAVVNGITEHQSERRGLRGSYWSRNKYKYVEQANAELEAAEKALSNLGVELRQWAGSQRQRLNFDSRLKTLDVWSRNSLGGVINSEKIRRTWRQVEKTIPEVRAIRDELQRTYDELNETYERYQSRKKRV